MITSKPTQGRRMVQLWGWSCSFPASPTPWESTFGQQDALGQSPAALYLIGPIRRDFGKSRRCNVKKGGVLSCVCQVNRTRGLPGGWKQTKPSFWRPYFEIYAVCLSFSEHGWKRSHTLWSGEWCLHLKGIVGLLNLHIRHGLRSLPFTVYCQKADYHIVYPKHRQPFISESVLWVGTVLKEMPSLSRALTNVPLSLSNIRDHLFFGIGSFCCRGQFREATFTKLFCPASSISSGSTVINSTDINSGKSRVNFVHKTPLWIKSGLSGRSTLHDVWTCSFPLSHMYESYWLS